MRWVVLIIGLAGAGFCGFLGYRWWDTVKTVNPREVDASRLLVADASKANMEEEMKKYDKETVAMYGLMKLTGAKVEDAAKLVDQYDMRSKSYMAMFMAAGLGLLGALLAVARKGLLAALCFFVGLAVPVFFWAGTFVFVLPYVLAGILAVFVRPPAQETAAAAAS
jgi:hypothetical protein